MVSSVHSKVDVKTTIQSKDERRAKYRTQNKEEDEAVDNSFKQLFRKLAGAVSV